MQQLPKVIVSAKHPIDVVNILEHKLEQLEQVTLVEWSGVFTQFVVVV